MARILIADMPEGVITLERILQGHECTVVNTMKAAATQLKAQAFDLMVAGLHFDGSQMFELIREVRKSQKNADKPIICFCSHDTLMSPIMHKSLELTTTVLGAWMYLAEQLYSVHQNPDAELRRIMERCLTEEARKDIQQQRLDIQRQRADLQQLRMLLQAQEWSPELKEYVVGMKDDLELLLKELTRLHSAADAQSLSVTASRDRKDRVAEHVRLNENDMTSTEEIQSADETRQSAGEDQLAAKEKIKEADGQRKQRDEFENKLKNLDS